MTHFFHILQRPLSSPSLKRVRVGIVRLWMTVVGCCLALLASCIEPPLHLPAEEVMVDVPLVVTEMEVVWNVDIDWQAEWHYGWDSEDVERWGELKYPTPQKGFEVRRYFLGDQIRVPHTNRDPFWTPDSSFQRTYEFGYYDMLIWSRVNENVQAVTIDESDLDNTVAYTTITRSVSLRGDNAKPTALYNQPEIFYSAYPRDIHISRNFDDYDYFDDVRGVWVKHINSALEPLVYIYLVQIIITNNEDGRVRGISGDCALSNMASHTNVNTGHTLNKPCMLYFTTNMKRDIFIEGQRTDIIGGKLTTYGLCDMEGINSDTRAQYHGSRADLTNNLLFELQMAGGSTQTLIANVTQQCQQQCHGGVITIWLDAKEVPDPHDDPGAGSLFNPTVEDYDELDFDIPM